MKSKVKITVFTPTYNRGEILINLYHSLQNQNFSDFEWLIIDDGSIDNTFAIVSEWKNENNSFKIRYYKKKNGGKCRAINKALDLAKGELFFTVDSDDVLTYDALDKINSWSEDLADKKDYCGFAGNMSVSNSIKINREFKLGYFDGDAFSRYKEVDGERAMIFYTDVHRKYKYPEFENENFFTSPLYSHLTIKVNKQGLVKEAKELFSTLLKDKDFDFLKENEDFIQMLKRI